MHERRGFTLIELLIYSAIFGIVSLTLVYFLTTFFRVSGYQTSSAGVANQANFILQKIQQQVAGASFLVVRDDAANDETDAATSVPHSTLIIKDRAETTADGSDSKSPIVITRDAAANAITMKQGSQATTTLNNASVLVTGLTFTKVATPGGKDVVTIDLTLTYNSANPKERITKEFLTGVAKASAATFDTALNPGTTSSTDIGSGSLQWRSLYLSNNATIDGSVKWTTQGTNTAINSIGFLKQLSIGVNPASTPGNATSSKTYASSTIPELAGILPGDRIFVTPSADLENYLSFFGAKTDTDTIQIVLRNSSSSAIDGAVHPWSFLILR